MDVVGYSKMLVNEQREVVHQLNQIVRKTAQFRKSEAMFNPLRNDPRFEKLASSAPK